MKGRAREKEKVREQEAEEQEAVQGDGNVKARSKGKKIAGIVWSVVSYVFLALCIVLGVMAFVSKRSGDGAVNLFGYEMRIVLSGSMEKNELTDVSEYKIKSIPVKSLVVTKSVPKDDAKAAEWYGKLKVGDVLTFRYYLANKQETITHRIIGIEEETDGYKITLRGDNRTENEGEQVIHTGDDASPNYVLGKVVSTSVVFGNILYILQQPIGIALVVIVPSAIIMIIQIIRIVAVVGAEKRKKVEQREAAQSDEIELLKQRLAEMEKKQAASPAAEAEGRETEPAEALEAAEEREGNAGGDPDIKEEETP